ncbi:MAG: Flp pilus assembly complex ATPase component TadA [Deltaproteobacteria bacterium]|nr:Flp pilus assembly complex ATPase component TadA [Deltaproteobacteria bacterium]
MLALTIREKNGEERQLIFDKEEVTIGRATGSDIVLPRSNISKRHARLVDKHDKVVIVDLRSTNGTYVNGRRITAPELLTYDDKVYIGDFVIRLSRPAEQHPSQRMTAPYSASPTPAADGPRGMRAATQAVEPPGPGEFFDEEGAPPGPPPMDAGEPDDDASTRAISADLAAQIDDEPPRKAALTPVAKAAPAKAPAQIKKEAPAPPPPEPAPRPQPAAAKKEAPPPPPRKEAPPPPTKEPEPAPRARAARPATPPPPEEGAPTMMSLDKVRKPAPPPPEPEAEPVAMEAADLDGWAQWNGMLTALIQRIELDHPDGVDGLEAQDIAEGALASLIESGEIAPETDRDALVADALAEIVGLGALAELEADPTVRVVAINGPKAIFVDRGAGVLEPNGRLFATSTSYRRVLAMLVAPTGHRLAPPTEASPGVDELRLPDGSALRILEPGAGGDPLVVWRRAAVDAPTLGDLVADRFLDAAQQKDLEAATAHGKSVLVAGPHANVLASALAASWSPDRRIVAVGDGTRVALTHADVARVSAVALVSASDLLALEPDAIVFEALDGRSAYVWMEASLSSGRPVLAVSSEATAERALKRLGLVLELHGVPGRGGALVGEAVDLAVTLKTEADGSTRIERIDEVEAQKDGFTLKAKPRR